MKQTTKVNKSKKSKFIKTVAVVVFLLISTIICIYLFPVMKNINTEHGRIEFQNTIMKHGGIGMLLLLGLQFSQMLVAIIPGEPIEILAGMCYGTIYGTIFMLVTFYVFTTIIFFTVRKAGVNLVYTFCNDKQVDRIQSSKVFRNPKKVEKVLYILYLLPGTPKDLLTYVAGILPIEKPMRFLMISTIARIPSIVSSTIAGAGIVTGSIVSSIIIYILIYLIVVLSILIYKKIINEQDSEQALKELKNESNIQNNKKKEA